MPSAICAAIRNIRGRLIVDGTTFLDFLKNVFKSPRVISSITTRGGWPLETTPKSRTTWCPPAKDFITEASVRNSIRSRMVAFSSTVLTAQRMFAGQRIPSYTTPKEPLLIFRTNSTLSLTISHSSGSYTARLTYSGFDDVTIVLNVLAFNFFHIR